LLPSTTITTGITTNTHLVRNSVLRYAAATLTPTTTTAAKRRDHPSSSHHKDMTRPLSEEKPTAPSGAQTTSFVEQAKQTLANASETAQATTKRIVHSAQSGLEAVQGQISEARKQMGVPQDNDTFKVAQNEQEEAMAFREGHQQQQFPSQETGTMPASYEALYSTPLSAPSEFTTLGTQSEGPGVSEHPTTDVGTTGGGITGALSGMAHKVSETMSSAAERVGSMVGIGGGGSSGTGTTGIGTNTETPAFYHRPEGTGIGETSPKAHPGEEAPPSSTTAWEEYKQKASDTATVGKEATGKLAETGQRRTSEMGQATREKMGQLYDQTSQKAQETKEGTGNMMQGMKERTAETTDSIKQQATGAWQGVKDMFGSTHDDTTSGGGLTKENVHTAQPTLSGDVKPMQQQATREQVRELGDQAKGKINEMQRK